MSQEGDGAESGRPDAATSAASNMAAFMRSLGVAGFFIPLVSLAAADIRVLSCREERSEIEEAFLHLTRKEVP